MIPMQNFSVLPLSSDLKTVVMELGFETMTEIQERAIPPLLEGRDVIGRSKTGSGKTAAFGLPILNALNTETRVVQALVLCPTRELCAQVARELRRLGRRFAGLQVLVLSGGTPGRPQAEALYRGAHIAVGTPGRVLDHLLRENFDPSTLKTLVLDEADRMLDMGFANEMEALMERLPEARQTVLFSATYPPEIQKISRAYQKNPLLIEVADPVDAPSAIQQVVFNVEKDAKVEAAIEVLKACRRGSALIFCNQKATVAEVAKEFTRAGLNAGAIHGDLEQAERDQILALFRNGSRPFLVATDVAARGIDIPDLPLVINFDLANTVETYTHRIGRTGRAGKSGTAITLANASERLRLYDFSRELKTPIEDGTINDLKFLRDAVPAAQTAMQTLWISGGRKDKVRPGDILGALTGEAGGLDANHVGKIEIHDHHAFVAVAKDVAEKAARCLQNGRIKNRKFLVRLVN